MPEIKLDKKYTDVFLFSTLFADINMFFYDKTSRDRPMGG